VRAHDVVGCDGGDHGGSESSTRARPGNVCRSRRLLATLE
jgi:hypothetical protein